MIENTLLWGKANITFQVIGNKLITSMKEELASTDRRNDIIGVMRAGISLEGSQESIPASS